MHPNSMAPSTDPDSFEFGTTSDAELIKKIDLLEA
jgi:hypothetical protein